MTHQIHPISEQRGARPLLGDPIILVIWVQMTGDVTSCAD
jgi:hypothetical protein